MTMGLTIRFRIHLIDWTNGRGVSSNQVLDGAGGAAAAFGANRWWLAQY
jgi:hypothetical protein